MYPCIPLSVFIRLHKRVYIRALLVTKRNGSEVVKKKHTNSVIVLHTQGLAYAMLSINCSCAFLFIVLHV